MGLGHKKALIEVKREVFSTTILQFYDAHKPLILQVDSPVRGQGAALIQNRDPAAYASKNLTEAKQRYSNIEREMLGVVF